MESPFIKEGYRLYNITLQSVGAEQRWDISFKSEYILKFALIIKDWSIQNIGKIWM